MDAFCFFARPQTGLRSRGTGSAERRVQGPSVRSPFRIRKTKTQKNVERNGRCSACGGFDRRSRSGRAIGLFERSPRAPLVRGSLCLRVRFAESFGGGRGGSTLRVGLCVVSFLGFVRRSSELLFYLARRMCVLRRDVKKCLSANDRAGSTREAHSPPVCCRVWANMYRKQPSAHETEDHQWTIYSALLANNV